MESVGSFEAKTHLAQLHERGANFKRIDGATRVGA
jgi:hypothetical protein